VQVVSYGTKGWIKTEKKEFIIKEFTIPLPFLKREPYN
jgi:hypothetical protein